LIPTNLAKNAIQSIPSNKNLKARKIKKEDNNVPITVSDNGIGIQAAMRIGFLSHHHQK
jgi:sensor histidine kinase YesM